MKKFAIALLAGLFLVGSMMSFAGCEKNEAEKKTIVYLGDSIAEAVLGPSPISERENYGYYALLGKRNEYHYFNRSVSGHKTEGMLEYLKKEDTGISLVHDHIKAADVIVISIIGNDLLQEDVGSMIMQLMNEEYSLVDELLAQSRDNIIESLEIIKGLNKDALLIIQTVYNPIFGRNPLIHEDIEIELAELGYDSSDYRQLGTALICRMNSVIRQLCEERKDFVIADVYAEFDKIAATDTARANSLIYNDGVHPSNEGHAAIADVIQKILEDKGMTDHDTAVKNYKALRLEQLDRLYRGKIDTDAVSKKIKDAKECTEITQAYFNAVRDVIPNY